MRTAWCNLGFYSLGFGPGLRGTTRDIDAEVALAGLLGSWFST